MEQYVFTWLNTFKRLQKVKHNHTGSIPIKFMCVCVHDTYLIDHKHHIPCTNDKLANNLASKSHYGNSFSVILLCSDKKIYLCKSCYAKQLPAFCWCLRRIDSSRAVLSNEYPRRDITQGSISSPNNIHIGKNASELHIRKIFSNSLAKIEKHTIKHIRHLYSVSMQSYYDKKGHFLYYMRRSWNIISTMDFLILERHWHKTLFIYSTWQGVYIGINI